MSKVLGIVGSPRKNGNTHVLVSRVLDGARAGGAQTDLLMLGDMTIRECDGCHVCWQAKPCPKDDDMNGIYAKIAESDVLVFGTPVYWYGPTALMKAFVDRLVYFNGPENRAKIRGKKAVIAIPFEEEDLETAAPVVDFFERCFKYLQVEILARLVVPGVTLRGEVRKKKDVMEKAFEMGKGL